MVCIVDDAIASIKTKGLIGEKYIEITPGGSEEVIAPGTVIVSAAAHCNDITKVVEPVLKRDAGSLYYINWSKDVLKVGGSSFAQILNEIGESVPTVKDAACSSR